MNILVGGWKKPRGKVSVKYTEVLVALWIAGWDLKKGMSKLTLKFDYYSSKWEQNYAYLICKIILTFKMKTQAFKLN